jgi:uroporphyrinogen-III synthase
LDSNGLERDVPLYVTGKVLYDLAIEYGFTLVQYADGNANSLLLWLMAHPELKRQLLTVVHGNHIATDIASPLQDAGFRIRRQALYHSNTTRALPLEAITALKHDQVSAALFYSAFTAQSFMNLVTDAGLQAYLKGISAVGISENVLEALPLSAWRERLCTSSPALCEVISVLRSAVSPVCV